MCNRNNQSAGWAFRITGAITVAAFACASTGCHYAPAPMTLSLAPVATKSGSPARVGDADSRTARVLSVEVVPVPGQDSGNVFGHRIIATGLDERLVAALSNIVSSDVRIEARLGVGGAKVADASEGPGVARVSFAKAYIHDIGATGSAVVVLKLEHAGSTSYFRAQRANFISGYRKALIRAFDEAVAKLRPELLKLAEAPDPVK